MTTKLSGTESPTTGIAANVARDYATNDLAKSVASLTEHLTVTADAQGLLDVTYDIVETPVSALLIAATTAGIVRVGFACEDHAAVLAELERKVGPRVLRSETNPVLRQATRELDEYFNGQRRVFSVAVDLRLTTPFRRSVLEGLTNLEYGTTASYADAAIYAGRASAVRAAATALATNPVPIVIPCHRIIRSDGSVGGYLGGLAAKRWLLNLERAA
jgi:methylated-DNA-[protein]-cysteine S-methyltransferase